MTQLERFHEAAGSMLHELSTILRPGAKLTLVCRRPDVPDGSQDILLTDDDVELVIEAARRLAARERTVL
jgi:hypothetical protein